MSMCQYIMAEVDHYHLCCLKLDWRRIKGPIFRLFCTHIFIFHLLLHTFGGQKLGGSELSEPFVTSRRADFQNCVM